MIGVVGTRAGRVLVSLTTIVAVALATLDPCAMACHARSGATSSTASTSAHCRAASEHAATTWQTTAVCHHGHDAAALDATPQSRTDSPPRIIVAAPADGLYAVALAVPAVIFDIGHHNSHGASSESSAFTVPLRL
jgi:hypothetical protein